MRRSTYSTKRNANEDIKEDDSSEEESGEDLGKSKFTKKDEGNVRFTIAKIKIL